MIVLAEVSETRELAEKAVHFYWNAWGTPGNFNFYRDSILNSLDSNADLSKFYVALEGESIVGSVALLRNDLISRQDLVPWLGCLYVLPEYRGFGLGGRMLQFAVQEAGRKGYPYLYLSTSLEGYYEKYGWTYLDQAYSFNGDPARVYRKQT